MPPRPLAATRLMLIRNAEGIGDHPPRIRTHTDRGLGELGRAQVDQLVARFAATGELDGVTRLMSSNGNRAQETAVALESLIDGVTLEPACGFCDPHAVEAEGREFAEWLATDGQVRLDNFSPYSPKVPGDGESFAVGLQRAAQALIETAIANEGGFVVIVSGALVQQAAFWLFLGLPFHAAYLDLAHIPASITEWTVTGWLPGSGHPQGRLERCNDARHLLVNRS